MITPTRGHIVVRLSQQESRTASGLFKPSSANTPRNRGTVVRGELWADADNGPVLEEGDEILFRSGAGERVELNDEEFLVLKVEDVLAVL